MPETVLIVDDESSHLRMAEYAIGQKLGYRAVTVGGGEEAVKWVLSGKQPQPDLILLDLAMPAPGGLEVIRQVKACRPQLPVIALVAYGDDAQAAQAVEAGVNDFLSKPVALDRLKLSLRNVFALQRMGNAIMRLERKITGHVSFSDIIGQCAAMKKILALADAAASSKLPIWIEGERGCGKEFLARAIHGSGDRAGKPFIIVDCGALADETAEALLFGQEKMPGATHFILGKLREADKGTLFLKDIGSLDAALQHRLLEAIAEGSVTPLGAKSPVALDVRFIASSCQSMKPLIAAGAFSHMLYRRFQEMTITVPPLRERREDIVPLARHFTVTYAAAENKHMIGVSEEALQHLAAESWPGNLHQLSRLMWRAVMICNQEMLDLGNLRLIEQWQPVYYKDYGDNVLAAASPMLFDGSGRMRKLKSIEEEIIRLALRHNGGCMTRAANSLGIGRSTLYRRVNDLGIEGYISRANQAMRPMMTVSAAERS